MIDYSMRRSVTHNASCAFLCDYGRPSHWDISNVKNCMNSNWEILQAKSQENDGGWFCHQKNFIRCKELLKCNVTVADDRRHWWHSHWICFVLIKQKIWVAHVICCVKTYTIPYLLLDALVTTFFPQNSLLPPYDTSKMSWLSEEQCLLWSSLKCLP